MQITSCRFWPEARVPPLGTGVGTGVGPPPLGGRYTKLATEGVPKVDTRNSI